MGSLCSLGSDITQQTKIRTYNSTEEILFNSGLFIQENPNPFTDIYSVIPSHLGYGSYGEVILCKHLRTVEKRAVKIIKKKMISSSQLTKRTILNEINILKSLDHPNILKIFEYFEDKKYYYIVMEYFPDGDLLEELESVQRFTEKDCSKIMAQILAAVAYLHGKSITHRDLKLENILICKEKKEIWVKIIDFNVATYVRGELSLIAGTAQYLAPEVIEGSYNEKCDLWSCGVIMYLMLSGVFPFTGTTRFLVLENIVHGSVKFNDKVWEKVSDQAKDLIRNLLHRSPSQRFTAVQALNHPWITSLEVQSDGPLFQRTLTRMRTLTKKPKLRELFETFLLGQVQKNNPKIKLFEKVFLELDADRNGVISCQDIQSQLTKELGHEDALRESEKILKAYDNDGSGVIDFTEFLRVALEEDLYVCKENLRKAFCYFDQDQSEMIDKVEMMDWLSEGAIIPMYVIEELIEEADKNKDGVIDLEEFENLLMEKIYEEESVSEDLEL